MPPRLPNSHPGTGWKSAAIQKGTLGPAMQALNPRQQAFVDYLVTNGIGDRGWTDAALAVGYSPDGSRHGASQTAYDLRRMPTVLAAIREESERRLQTNLPVLQARMLEVATNPTHKDFAKMNLAAQAMQGMSPITKAQTEVSHTIDAGDLLTTIREQAALLGLDPEALLHGKIIDVTPAQVRIEHKPELTADEQLGLDQLAGYW